MNNEKRLINVTISEANPATFAIAKIRDSFRLPVMEQRSETLLWHPWSHTRFRPPQNDNIGKEHFCLLTGSEDQEAFDKRDGGGNRHWWSIQDAGPEERHDALNRRPPGTVYPLPLKPADNRSGQLYARAMELFTSALRIAEPRYTTTHGGCIRVSLKAVLDLTNPASVLHQLNLEELLSEDWRKINGEQNESRSQALG